MEKIIVAPMFEHLLTEAGQQNIDWQTMDDEVQASHSVNAADDFEQGYWMDVNEVAPPNLIWTRCCRGLPEDIRSGLNWSADKKFCLSVLRATRQNETDTDDFDANETQVEDVEDLDLVQLRERQIDFPELVEREMVVLIQTRNSVVAACLWRKQASAQKLAANTIRIDAWCGVISPFYAIEGSSNSKD